MALETPTVRYRKPLLVLILLLTLAWSLQQVRVDQAARDISAHSPPIDRSEGQAIVIVVAAAAVPIVAQTPTPTTASSTAMVGLARTSKTSLTTSASFNDSGSSLDILALLRGRRLLFIGDSTLRYQYLNLVNFVTSGMWSAPRGLPSLEKETDWPGWGAFMRGSSKRLKYEVCDCYRSTRNGATTMLENRYYHHVPRDVRMSLVTQFGSLPVVMHRSEFLNASCDATGCRQSGCQPSLCAQNATPPDSFLPPLAGPELWAREVCRQSPDVVFLNVGHWRRMYHLSEEDVVTWLEKLSQLLTAVKNTTTADSPSCAAPLSRLRIIWVETFRRYPLTLEQVNDAAIRKWIATRVNDVVKWSFLDTGFIFNVTTAVAARHSPTPPTHWDQIHLTTSTVVTMNRYFMESLKRLVDS